MIRRATPADAEALSDLSRTCFTQTFGHLYAPSDLEAFLDEAYSPTVLRTELNDPERATWLLFEQSADDAACGMHTPTDHPSTPAPEAQAPASSASDELIGYVTACPAHLPHPDVAPGDGEIQRLYILQGHQGGGRGTALLRTALEWPTHDLDRRVERKLRGAALLRAPRLRDRRRLLLHGGRPRRPRTHHVPPPARAHCVSSA